jgi:hypothetical protein
MKKVLLIIVGVLVLLCVFSYSNNNNIKGIISRLEKKGSLGGEAMDYKISILGIIPVGEASFAAKKAEQINGVKVFHLGANARSLDYISALFRGSITLDSYVDTVNLNPLFFKQKISVSGKPDALKEVSYDQDNHVMTKDGVKREILPNTHDSLSLMFYLRRMNFDKQSDFEFNINNNQKNYTLKGTSKPSEISLNNKIYKIALLKTVIRRRDKTSSYHQTELSMVLLRDSQNLPVLINIFASGMLVNAKLIGIE